MLVLTRRVGEALVVDEKVEITVLEVRGRQVRLGIRAPRDVAVHRAEIQQAIQVGEVPPMHEVIVTQPAFR